MDSELAELAAFLADDSVAKRRLPAVACEGFLMGVISSPDLILPSEWLPIVLGLSDAPAFEDMVSAKRITSLIMRWYNQILHDFDNGEDELALSIADENGDLSPGAAIIWAAGYFEAMMLRLEFWERFEAEPEGELLEPIFALLECRDKPRNWKRKATAAAKKLPEYIGEIYEYWLEKRSQPKRRAAPKIGRNDPCSCGSGKKFKRCCGVA